MSSLVRELQRDALSSISVSDLLKKGMVVARKLKLKEFEDWLTLELRGYPDDAKPPSYRVLSGQVKVLNPYHGWQPVIISHPEMAKIASKAATGSSVSMIENLISGKHASYILPLNKQIETEILNGLRTSTGRRIKLQVALHITASQMHGVLETVRSIVLDWSLKLEERGILGEGMSFSIEEKKKATKSKYQIKTFINKMSRSQLQQDTVNSQQTYYADSFDAESLNKLIDTVRDCISHIKMDDSSKAEIDADVNTIETQVKSPKPKSAVIRESLHSIRNILEGATGSGLATGIIYEITRLLQ